MNHWNKKITGVVLTTVAVVLLAGCGSGGTAPDEDLVAIDKTELETLVEAATFKEEALYYRDFVLEFTEKMTEEEKAELIKREWQYTVEVNGVKFPTSGELDLTAEKIEVTISENRVPFSVLPMEESVKGKILQPLNHAAHMNGQSLVMTTVEQTETDHVLNFVKDEVKSGEMFTIFVQPDLATRLGMEEGTDQLTIRIR